MSDILGIRRAPEFSPNNTGNDSAIFSQTVAELEGKGYKVRQLTEEEFFHTDVLDEPLIFSMIRNKQNVQKLKALQESGKRVINSGFGIEKCFRANMTELLLQHHIPHPKSEIVPITMNVESVFEKLGNKNVWIKRGDFHTVHKEDIAFCRSCAEGNTILKEFALRGIPNAVLSQHLTGDLVKFYAVEGTPFFYWFYPFETHHLTTSNQDIERTHHYAFNENELKSMAAKAAQILDVKIYGGDAIISIDNQIKLIDVNDWPSFSPCRKEAAKHIATAILNELN